MTRIIPTLFILTASLQAGWVIEDIPTGIQYNGSTPMLVTREFATAFRAIYNSDGVKTGEYVAIAYRSKYMYVVLRKGTGWNSMRFDDTGRYPSIALDSSGKIHMSYFRASNKKLYYARTVAEGTGNCGPSATWACEEVPATIFGAPIFRSAIAVHGSKVHLLVESASGNATYPSTVTRITKTIGAANWDGTADQVTFSKDLEQMTIKVDNSGNPQVLLNSEYLDWYRRTGFNWAGIGPLVGTGSFDFTTLNAPRICYRDLTSNRLIYARSNGSEYWTESVLDYDIGPQGNCSIAVPKDNGPQIIGYYSPRIAYFDDISNAIKYARPPFYSGTTWAVETVASATGARSIHLYLDKSGRPAILYFDSANMKLQIARWQ